jgi:hypothetical protein
MYFQKIFSSRLSSLFKLTFVAGIIVALPACASSDTWFKQADSPLPIEVQHSGSGQVMSFRAHETSDRLYVAGTARKHRLSPTAHVDIQLIGSSGHVIAEDQNDINPLHSAPGGGKRFTDSYVVSFPLSDARKAVKIRVIYHGGAHSKGQP